MIEVPAIPEISGVSSSGEICLPASRDFDAARNRRQGLLRPPKNARRLRIGAQKQRGFVVAEQIVGVFEPQPRETVENAFDPPRDGRTCLPVSSSFRRRSNVRGTAQDATAAGLETVRATQASAARRRS